ncbi:hypothetical protein AALO_G00064040 [Alosa alosa]|uniref:Uncharacterized protein n=1 Tax=Alosa alosa TaxID=278164 RepID=A0AAV6H0G3_9TELE|nr:hypothetical protein AALO_G00064040 [Alosa alosa]
MLRLQRGVRGARDGAGCPRRDAQDRSGTLADHIAVGHPRLFVLLHQSSSFGCGCGALGRLAQGGQQGTEQDQAQAHQQPQQEEGHGHGQLHEVEDGRAELAEHARQEVGAQRHARVQRQLGQHEGVVAAAVAHQWVERLALVEQRRHPDGQLEDAGEEEDDAAGLHGLGRVARVVPELGGQLVGQRQAAYERQGEGVEEAHEARGARHVQEERVVYEPQQAHRGERAEVGQELRTVVPQRRHQAAPELLLHRDGHRLRY